MVLELVFETRSTEYYLLDDRCYAVFDKAQGTFVHHDAIGLRWAGRVRMLLGGESELSSGELPELHDQVLFESSKERALITGPIIRVQFCWPRVPPRLAGSRLANADTTPGATPAF